MSVASPSPSLSNSHSRSPRVSFRPSKKSVRSDGSVHMSIIPSDLSDFIRSTPRRVASSDNSLGQGRRWSEEERKSVVEKGKENNARSRASEENHFRNRKSKGSPESLQPKSDFVEEALAPPRARRFQPKSRPASSPPLGSSSSQAPQSSSKSTLPRKPTVPRKSSLPPQSVQPPKSAQPPPPPPPTVSDSVPVFKFYRTTFNDDSMSGHVTGIEVAFKLVAVKGRAASGQTNGSEDDDKESDIKDILAVGGFRDSDNRGVTCVVHRYSLLKQRWEKYAEMPEGRLNFAVAYLKRHLYVIGGYDPKAARNGVRATTDTFRYDPTQESWDKVADLNVPRSFHTACCHGGRIYAFGGHDGSDRVLKSAEVYDPSAQRWSFIQPMSCGRVGASCVSFSERVVVTGGYGEAENDRSPCPVLPTTEWFDPATCKWTQKGPLRVARSQACLVQYRDCLYMCGGVTRDPFTGVLCSMCAVDMYDPDKKEWVHITDMKTARHNAGAVLIFPKLYVVGGFSTVTNELLRSVECFNISNETWDTEQCLPCGAKSLACVIIPGKTEE